MFLCRQFLKEKKIINGHHLDFPKRLSAVFILMLRFFSYMFEMFLYKLYKQLFRRTEVKKKIKETFSFYFQLTVVFVLNVGYRCGKYDTHQKLLDKSFLL